MAKRKKPKPPANRKLQALALAEWSPLTANGNRQWCLILDRGPQSSKVLLWHGPDKVHNRDLRVVSLEEAARFQADWNNLPVLVTELLVLLTCSRMRLQPAWLTDWQLFSIVIAGPERHDGQAPFQYWIHGRDKRHAEQLALTFHQADQGTTDVQLVSATPGRVTGGHWNDLRIGQGAKRVSLKTVQCVHQWYAHIARTTLPPGRPQPDKLEKSEKVEESESANSPEPV